MEKDRNSAERTPEEGRVRVILPVNMADPKDLVLEGSVNGEAFTIPRGVSVLVTLAQYEVLRASGRVPIY